jgi:hypothetical protein
VLNLNGYRINGLILALAHALPKVLSSATAWFAGKNSPHAVPTTVFAPPAEPKITGPGNKDISKKEINSN